MDTFMKQEILDHLPIPREVRLPEYFENTISEEIKSSGASSSEIDAGYRVLQKYYRNLKESPQIDNIPIYQRTEIYIAYINYYLRDYYPRMYLILNHLLKYTKFFELLEAWNKSPIKILDIGAGPGTMIYSFIDYLEYISHLGRFDFNYDVQIIEQEQQFLKFLENLNKNLKTTNPNVRDKITIESPLETKDLDFDYLEDTLKPLLNREKYNVIILSFIINENVPNREKIKDIIKILSNNLKDEGIIILLEAPSDYLYEYFEIDFEKEIGLIRNAPCLNGNKIYDRVNKGNCPFFSPCGDLCTFQISGEERNKFCYLVLSKKDFLNYTFENEISKSIGFFKKYKRHLFDFNEKMANLGETFNTFGIFTNKEIKEEACDYYFCNGGCRFKIDNLQFPELEIVEGDIIYFKNLIYDGVYIKKNKKHKPFIVKPFGELGVKFDRDLTKKNHSSYEIIPYFHP